MKKEQVEELLEKREFKELKELLGHTPLQVFAGAALGFLFAFFIY